MSVFQDIWQALYLYDVCLHYQNCSRGKGDGNSDFFGKEMKDIK